MIAKTHGHKLPLALCTRVRHRTTRSRPQRQAISKLETPSTTRLRPSVSISPMYRDNLFAIDPPSYTPSLNTSTSGEERFLAGRRVDRVSNIQTSWQVLPDLIPEPEVAVQVRAGVVLEDRWKITSSTSGGERGEASVSSIYRFWITW